MDQSAIIWFLSLFLPMVLASLLHSHVTDRKTDCCFRRVGNSRCYSETRRHSVTWSSQRVNLMLRLSCVLSMHLASFQLVQLHLLLVFFQYYKRGGFYRVACSVSSSCPQCNVFRHFSYEFSLFVVVLTEYLCVFADCKKRSEARGEPASILHPPTFHAIASATLKEADEST